MENNSRPSLNLDLPGAGPPDPGGNEQLNWLQLGIGSQSASGDIVALQVGQGDMHRIRDFYLPKFQDVVQLKFWKSWTFPNFRTISAYFDVNTVCLLYTWGETVLSQNSANKNPAGSRPRSNTKTIFTDRKILNIRIRPSWDHLIIIMGIPILVRWHTCNATVTWALIRNVLFN